MHAAISGGWLRAHARNAAVFCSQPPPQSAATLRVNIPPAQGVAMICAAAANAEEADDGSSRRDCLAKERVVLRELKETRLRLRVLDALGEVSESEKRLLDESTQLVRIISTIIRNAGR
jgi:hypothetical protein